MSALVFPAAYSTYEFRVRAVNDIGAGGPSIATQFQTPESGTFGAKPNTLNFMCSLSLSGSADDASEPSGGVQQLHIAGCNLEPPSL